MRQAYRWTAAGGMQVLGWLDAGRKESESFAVSADGTTVVGTSEVGYMGTNVPFRWTAQSGMVALGSGGQAYAVSADGSVIAGGGASAFIWDAQHGMRNLQNLLVNDLHLNLTGWTLTQVRGMSADGMTLVGFGTNPAGHPEGWIAQVPEPATMLLALAGIGLLARRRQAA
jgi:uncharacterized membrane protein